MLALVLLVASTLTIACAICSAFLAYKERPQWVWFAALAVLAEVDGLEMLSAVSAHQLARRA
jgi:hypothetical protein